MAFAPRPEGVWVTDHWFRIEWLDSGEFIMRTDRDDADGVTWDHRKSILVRLHPETPESHYQDVVLHEVTHAVWGVVRLTQLVEDIKDNHEEQVILMQTHGLLSVLKNNPEFVRWLQSDGTVMR